MGLSKKKEKDVESSEFPKGFAGVLVSLGGEDKPPYDNEIGFADGVEEEDVFSISNEITKQETAITPEVGQLIEGKGIYIGTWEPIDEKGKSLNKVWG